jgi:hypothetical protein
MFARHFWERRVESPESSIWGALGGGGIAVVQGLYVTAEAVVGPFQIVHAVCGRL